MQVYLAEQTDVIRAAASLSTLLLPSLEGLTSLVYRQSAAQLEACRSCHHKYKQTHKPYRHDLLAPPAFDITRARLLASHTPSRGLDYFVMAKLPTTMKGLVKETEGPSYAYKDIPVPVPRCDELLVKVGKVALCGSDIALHQWNHGRYLYIAGRKRDREEIVW